VAAAREQQRTASGTSALLTERLSGVPEIARAESLGPGEMLRVAFAGEFLGAARVRARFAAMPLEAFDRVGEVLAADEQGAYFQLMRLAYGEGRNFCRATKKELLRRLGLSERCLARILDALLAKGFVRPLHRDNRGTLFRVYLPAEAFGEPVGDDVLLGRARPGRAESRADKAAPAPAALFEKAPRRIPRDELARELARARGCPEAWATAAEELAALERDGATPRQIAACVRAVTRRAEGASAPLERGMSP